MIRSFFRPKEQVKLYDLKPFLEQIENLKKIIITKDNELKNIKTIITQKNNELKICYETGNKKAIEIDKISDKFQKSTNDTRLKDKDDTIKKLNDEIAILKSKIDILQPRYEAELKLIGNVDSDMVTTPGKVVETDQVVVETDQVVEKGGRRSRKHHNTLRRRLRHRNTIRRRRRSSRKRGITHRRRSRRVF
jgi:hypothetical protein